MSFYFWQQLAWDTLLKTLLISMSSLHCLTKKMTGILTGIKTSKEQDIRELSRYPSDLWEVLREKSSN